MAWSVEYLFLRFFVTMTAVMIMTVTAKINTTATTPPPMAAVLSVVSNSAVSVVVLSDMVSILVGDVSGVV